MMVVLPFRFAVVQVRITYWANQRTAMIAEGEYSNWLIHNVTPCTQIVDVIRFAYYIYDDYCISVLSTHYAQSL